MMTLGMIAPTLTPILIQMLTLTTGTATTVTMITPLKMVTMEMVEALVAETIRSD